MVNPIEPTQPLNPIEPTQPLNPIEPTQPLNPIEPTQPLNPIEPTQPLVKPTPRPTTIPTKPTPPSMNSTDTTLFPEIIPCSKIQFYDWRDSIGILLHSLSRRLQGTLRNDSESVVNQIRSGLL